MNAHCRKILSSITIIQLASTTLNLSRCTEIYCQLIDSLESSRFPYIKSKTIQTSIITMKGPNHTQPIATQPHLADRMVAHTAPAIPVAARGPGASPRGRTSAWRPRRGAPGCSPRWEKPIPDDPFFWYIHLHLPHK